MTTLKTQTGILAIKSISLGLLLLIVFLIQFTIWAIENILVPSVGAIAKMVIAGIQALNEWAGKQAIPRLPARLVPKMLPVSKVIGLLPSARPRVLITPSILPSCGAVIAIAPIEYQMVYKATEAAYKLENLGYGTRDSVSAIMSILKPEKPVFKLAESLFTTPKKRNRSKKVIS
jgi:hypothetical protein